MLLNKIYDSVNAQYTVCVYKGYQFETTRSWMFVFTLFGVTTTDITMPSSSSVALGEATKTGSDGYRPGHSHTFDENSLLSNFILQIPGDIWYLFDTLSIIMDYNNLPLVPLHFYITYIFQNIVSIYSIPSSVSPGGLSLSVNLPLGVWSHSHRSSGRAVCCTWRS